MSLTQLVVRPLAVAWMSAAMALSPALAQTPAEAPRATEYEPTVGQEGKDVIWVPTAQTLVDRMLDLAKVTPQDYVIDLGSGDGRTVITAAKRGARALGIEYNPDMVALAERNAAKEGVRDRAKFMKTDLFEADLSQASVITMFLLPDINLKLRPKILGLNPGTRVVSNSFNMGEWTADETAEAREGCTSYCKAYFWIVPARVEGSWRLPQGELRLDQTFQTVSGTLRTKSGTAKVANGKLRGDRSRSPSARPATRARSTGARCGVGVKRAIAALSGRRAPSGKVSGRTFAPAAFAALQSRKCSL
jgi:SAM-dependent methyltransferase